MGGDEIEVSDDEPSDLEEYWSDKEKTAKFFKIDINIFDYETPLSMLANGIMEEAKPVKQLASLSTINWEVQNGHLLCSGSRELKDEALQNKAIMEGLISDDESSNDCWKRWKIHEIYYHNYDEGDYENETHKERHELCEEYAAVKEDEYDDLTITSEEACRAYQEIFRMMDEGWMVTRTE
ncbi:hypothetical protein Tco_1547869 [Tanacetum coccineum]